MKFKFRLAYYLFGLLIGSMFLTFFLKEKKAEFCYLPNCRVLKDLRSKPISYSAETTAKFNEKWVSMDDIKKTLEYGDVDFSKSNKPLDKGKLYIVEGKNANNENITVSIVNYSDKVIVKDVKKE
ncbi:MULTISPECIES: DUF4258 domain-containing protein [Flavobacterium]|uniref:DUF4258 domain-containing protein n=1 Tax=Flavobacterium TaxID=237 RepID=UPI000965E04F|nr:MULTISPECIES: DUF4258 domain-containing protein [Flavobacterium]MBN9285468.1 DUF4258 domain-containing protein [Flavobacterium sp.]OJV71459.1 MAG: hypothetical protein BGO42_06285 [Flavobacterium sp. 40-81]